MNQLINYTATGKRRPEPRTARCARCVFITYLAGMPAVRNCNWLHTLLGSALYLRQRLVTEIPPKSFPAAAPLASGNPIREPPALPLLVFLPGRTLAGPVK